MQEKDLQYGAETIVEPGECIYLAGDELSEKPVYYIIAGLIKIEYNLANDMKFPLYLFPEALFGVIDPFLGINRLTSAYSVERSILYCWDLENFDIASSVSWELALTTITGLTQKLRILNAEFGAKLGLTESGLES